MYVCMYVCVNINTCIHTCIHLHIDLYLKAEGDQENGPGVELQVSFAPIIGLFCSYNRPLLLL